MTMSIKLGEKESRETFLVGRASFRLERGSVSQLGGLPAWLAAWLAHRQVGELAGERGCLLAEEREPTVCSKVMQDAGSISISTSSKKNRPPIWTVLSLSWFRSVLRCQCNRPALVGVKSRIHSAEARSGLGSHRKDQRGRRGERERETKKREEESYWSIMAGPLSQGRYKMAAENEGGRVSPSAESAESQPSEAQTTRATYRHQHRQACLAGGRAGDRSRPGGSAPHRIFFYSSPTNDGHHTTLKQETPQRTSEALLLLVEPSQRRSCRFGCRRHRMSA